MAESKITKTMVLNAIKEIVAEDVEIEVGEDVVTGADIIAYCDTTIGQIALKAEKAAARAKDKKAEGDALRAEVLSHINDEFKTGDEITAEITAVEGYDDVTKSKVVARLRQLVDNGDIVKEQVKRDDRKQMAYKLA